MYGIHLFGLSSVSVTSSSSPYSGYFLDALNLSPRLNWRTGETASKMSARLMDGLISQAFVRAGWTRLEQGCLIFDGRVSPGFGSLAGMRGVTGRRSQSLEALRLRLSLSSGATSSAFRLLLRRFRVGPSASVLSRGSLVGCIRWDWRGGTILSARWGGGGVDDVVMM